MQVYLKSSLTKKQHRSVKKGLIVCSYIYCRLQKMWLQNILK